MTFDHDGKIRMDCSSPYAMAGLVQLKDRFDIAFGNDPDADRHGIVTPSFGLLNPKSLSSGRHSLSPYEPSAMAGSAQSSVKRLSAVASLIASLPASSRKLWEVPVGFKWFTSRPLRWVLLFWRRRKRWSEFPET